MSRPAGLPFSVPLLILDLLGALLMAFSLISHFGGQSLLPPALAPWALPLAGFGFALTLPFSLDMLRRAMRRRQGGAAPDKVQESAVRRG